MTKDYEDIGAGIGRLVDSKNKAYGDSFSKSGEVLKLLYPNGVTLEQYDDMLAIIRVIDKLFRIGTDNDPFGEDAWQDITGYCILKVNKEDNKTP